MTTVEVEVFVVVLELLLSEVFELSDDVFELVLPESVVVEVVCLDAVIPIRFGTLYVIVNAVLLLFALIFDRKKIGIATFINLFLLGYIVEFSQGVCERLMPGAPLWLRIVILLVAIVILCLSSSLYFTADLGVSTYDAVALIWSQRQSKIKFAFCRVICDFVCVAAGVALLFASGQNIEQILGSVGIGTIITAFFMGPLITFFNKNVAQKILTAGSK